jgi:hypothetical protein
MSASAASIGGLDSFGVGREGAGRCSTVCFGGGGGSDVVPEVVGVGVGGVVVGGVVVGGVVDVQVSLAVPVPSGGHGGGAHGVVVVVPSAGGHGAGVVAGVQGVAVDVGVAAASHVGAGSPLVGATPAGTSTTGSGCTTVVVGIGGAVSTCAGSAGAGSAICDCTGSIVTGAVSAVSVVVSSC